MYSGNHEIMLGGSAFIREALGSVISSRELTRQVNRLAELVPESSQNKFGVIYRSEKALAGTDITGVGVRLISASTDGPMPETNQFLDLRIDFDPAATKDSVPSRALMGFIRKGEGKFKPHSVTDITHEPVSMTEEREAVSQAARALGQINRLTMTEASKSWMEQLRDMGEYRKSLGRLESILDEHKADFFNQEYHGKKLGDRIEASHNLVYFMTGAPMVRAYFELKIISDPKNTFSRQTRINFYRYNQELYLTGITDGNNNKIEANIQKTAVLNEARQLLDQAMIDSPDYDHASHQIFGD